MKYRLNGQLEIDEELGRIYFHLESGRSILRIQNIGTIRTDTSFIDLKSLGSHKGHLSCGCSYCHSYKSIEIDVDNAFSQNAELAEDLIEEGAFKGRLPSSLTIEEQLTRRAELEAQLERIQALLAEFKRPLQSKELHQRNSET